jgi:nucleoside-diphosphate-sugar epimerase
MKKYLFIGGPGNLSEHTINFLQENSENKITVFTLPESPELGLSDRVTFYRGNRDNAPELNSVINECKPDVIVDTVCFLPEQAKMIAEAAKEKVSQFAFISTCDVYGYPLTRIPLRETDAWVKTNSAYAENKRLCEEVFNSYYSIGVLPLTIIRPSYSMGNEFLIDFYARDNGARLIPRLKAGKPVIVPGDGTALMHVGAAFNTGRMIGHIAADYKTIGKSYTCGHNSYITQNSYIKLFADALGVEANIVHIPTDILHQFGCKEIEESILDHLTRHCVAFSMEAFITDFPDFKWEKTLEQAVSEYVKYNEARNFFKPENDDTFEDRLINAWKTATNGMNKII